MRQGKEKRGDEKRRGDEKQLQCFEEARTISRIKTRPRSKGADGVGRMVVM